MFYNCIVIDLVNLFYRQHFGQQEILRVLNGRPVGIQGVMNTVKFCQRMRRSHGCPVHLVVDNYTSGVERRRQIDPGYKSDRVAQSQSFYDLIDLTQELLLHESPDIRITRVPGYEADDLVPHVLRFEGASSALLVSSDLDWARMLTESVHWYDYTQTITPALFERRYGFRPGYESIVRYKSYTGDSGDHIPPGCPRIPKKLVAVLVQYGSLRTVLKDLDIIDELSYTWKKRLRDSVSRILLNERLVDFLPFKGNIAEFVARGAEKYEVLSEICTRLDIMPSNLYPELAARYPELGGEYLLG